MIFRLWQDALLLVLLLKHYPAHPEHLYTLLQAVADTLVLTLGTKTLVDPLPTDRLARELKVNFKYPSITVEVCWGVTGQATDRASAVCINGSL